MIAAQDLMIGDWVMYRGEPIIVYEIDEYYERVNTEPDGYDSIRCIELSDLQPIPLTAEILEKNGFKYKEADETCATEAFHQWRLDGSRFAIDDDSWWRSIKDGELHVKFGGFPLKYLHELQHALRLCGIDKEIKL